MAIVDEPDGQVGRLRNLREWHGDGKRSAQNKCHDQGDGSEMGWDIWK